MSEIGVAYASNDPAHLEDFKQWSDEINKWLKECRAWAKNHGGEALILQPPPWSPWQFEFAGLKSTYGKQPTNDWRNLKLGWHYALVPKRSTREGKKLALEFDRLKRSPTVTNGQLAGMPSHHLAGLSMQSPSVRDLGGRLYVAWSETPKPEPDPELWSEIPRSEYYRAVEKQEAIEAESVS